MRSYTLRLRAARILELLKQGFNSTQVAKILATSPASVRYHANKLAKQNFVEFNQTPSGRTSWKGSCKMRKAEKGTLSPMQKEHIQELINQNKGISEIALKAFGKDTRKARKSILRESKIQTPTN